MTTFGNGQNWRAAAERAVTAQQSDTLDADYWQARLEDQYALEVAPSQQAVWGRAVLCLAAYGGERCFKNGPLGHREDPALSTGLLLLGEPDAYKDGSVMRAVRLSTADTKLQARHLPLREVKRASKKHATDEAIDIATGALDSVAGLNTIRIDALVVATNKELLYNNDYMRGKVREAKMPIGYRGKIHLGEGSPNAKDLAMRSVLWSRPEVALWCRPLESFDNGRNQAYIRRPVVPELSMPDNRSLDGWQRAITNALAQAHEQQPHTDTILDMLMHVTVPVRSALGKRAVVSLLGD